MKILFSDNTLWGLLNFRGAVIRHFIKLGYDVVIVAPEKEASQMRTAIPDDIRLIPVKMDRAKATLLNDVKYFIHILQIYRSEKPDYIFHYTIKPNIYGSIAAKICGIKSTAMMPGLGYAFTSNGIVSRVARILYKIGLSCTHHLFLLNKDNYDVVVGRNVCAPKKIVLLDGGEGVDIDTFKFQDNCSDKTTFLFIGRILYDKGYREYVECARQIKKEYPGVEFEMLGTLDPSYPNSVNEEELAADCRSGAIKHLGFTSDMMAVYARKGLVIVLPSFYGEGLNRSLMEACASGKPIITTDIAGCRETVVNGENGFCIEPKSTSALVSAVKKYLALTENERKAMSTASRKLAEQRFDMKNVIKKYEEIVAN